MTELVPVTRTIVDRRAELEDALRVLHARGRLVTPPQDIRATATTGGRYWVQVQVMEPRRKLTGRQRLAAFDRRHPVLSPCLKALAFGMGAAVAVTGLVSLVVWAFVSVVSLRAIAVGGGVVVAAAIAAFMLSRSGGGHGDHKGMGWHYTKCK